MQHMNLLIVTLSVLCHELKFACYYVNLLRRQGVVSHCRIKSRADRGQVKYYLIENKLFDSLYGLITFYRQHPLKSHEFEQVLTEPVPQPESHRGKE